MGRLTRLELRTVRTSLEFPSETFLTLPRDRYPRRSPARRRRRRTSTHLLTDTDNSIDRGEKGVKSAVARTFTVSRPGREYASVFLKSPRGHILELGYVLEQYAHIARLELHFNRNQRARNSNNGTRFFVQRSRLHRSRKWVVSFARLSFMLHSKNGSHAC